MLKVFLTVDVEIWCDGWGQLDKKFPSAFRRYIYGETANGKYGLPFQLQVLQDYGLKGVFFVEPLFSTRFGLAPLQEIVSLIYEYGQEVQLHLHPEWVDESIEPIITKSTIKRQHLKYYSLNEQMNIIAKGISLLKDCGCKKIDAFRAGGFGANMDTLTVLENNAIHFDSSYDYTSSICEIKSPQALIQPVKLQNIYEYPMSFFIDYPGHCRHVQLGACSSKELQNMLFNAEKNSWDSVVILSHNFELMTQSKNNVDQVVLRRFIKLCELLNQRRDLFETVGFEKLQPVLFDTQPEPLKSNIIHTGFRVLEQVWRNRKQ